MITLKSGELKTIKNNYLLTFDNCIIYTYYDLRNHKTLIRDRINKLMFINQIKVNARKCIIKQINSKEKNEFLNQNHIQGTVKSQINYGAYYYDELVSVMSFNDSNRMTHNLTNGDYELSRFSIKTGIILVGIFNKTLKQFISDYKPNKIISYADLNVVNKLNNIYISNGFKNVKNIQPDFQFYHIQKDELFHKYTYGTKYIKNIKIPTSEKNENLKNLIKFWNCGKIKYELFINENQEIIEGFIYQIKNLVNNKLYIGQTTRPLHKRIYEYKSAFNLNKFHNQYLLNAFNKYGWDNFEFKIIDSGSTIDELNNKEISYIKKFNTTNKSIGYNISDGGRNSIPTIETLEKMSKAGLGRKQTDAWINKRIATAGTDEAKKYGRNKTDEEKKFLSEKSPKYWLGKTRDDKTKEKISKTKKERGLSDKQKKILFKKVYVKNPKTNELIETYESTTHASDVMGVNQSTVSRWCKNKKIINNRLWTY
jgi:group I intron endonuclease